MRKSFLPLFVLFTSLLVSSLALAQNSDFKPSGSLWGYVFGDYFRKAHSDSAGRGGKNVQYSPAVTSAKGANGKRLNLKQMFLKGSEKQSLPSL